MIAKLEDLEASWARARARLENVYAQLPASLANGETAGSVARDQECMAHNKLDLALDELEMLGEANEVDSTFWYQLLQAAAEMKLGARAEFYCKKLEH